MKSSRKVSVLAQPQTNQVLEGIPESAVKLSFAPSGVQQEELGQRQSEAPKIAAHPHALSRIGRSERVSSFAVSSNFNEINQAHQSGVRYWLKLPKLLHPITPRKTLLRKILPPGPASILYRFLLFKGVAPFFTMMWGYCAIMGLFYLAHYEVIPKYGLVLPTVVFSSYFIAFLAAFINLDILSLMAKTFNFWYIIAHVALFSLCVILLEGGSTESYVLGLYSFLSVFSFTVSDAFPTKLRNVYYRYIPFGIISCCAIFFIYLIRVEQPSQNFVRVGKADIPFNARSQLLTSALNSFIYLLRLLLLRRLPAYKDKKVNVFLYSFYEVHAPSYSLNLVKRLKDIKKRENGRMSSRLHTIQILPQGGEPLPNQCPKNTSQNDVDQKEDDYISKLIHALSSGKNNNANVKEYVIGIDEARLIPLSSNHTIFQRFFKVQYPRFAKVYASQYFMLFMALSHLVNTLSQAIIITKYKQDVFSNFSIAPWCIILTIMTILQILISSNPYVVRCTFRSFDFWYVVALLVQFLALLMYLDQGFERIVGCIYFCVISVWFLLVDALSIKQRYLVWLSIFAVIFNFYATISCRFNITAMCEGPEEVSLVFGIRISPRSLLSTTLLSMGIFFTRFLFSYWRNPNRVLFVTRNWSLIQKEDLDSDPSPHHQPKSVNEEASTSASHIQKEDS